MQASTSQDPHEAAPPVKDETAPCNDPIIPQTKDETTPDRPPVTPANNVKDETTPDPSYISPQSDAFGHQPTKERTSDTATPYEPLAQKNPSAWDHLSITIGPPVIILFDIVIPCIIYYVWFDVNRKQWVRDCSPYRDSNQPCPYEKPEFNEQILGYAIVSFGFGELYILIARVCRLVLHADECAPLLSRSVWELDATSWVYGVSMICALIPFVIGSSQEIPVLYLYSPACLMAFLGIIMIITLIPFPLPIGINSHARGSPMRPFIYYAAEDFIAVDGLQDREFRVRYNRRYDSSPNFRALFLHLTLWWIFGVCCYIGALSAVIWTLEFHYAFGLSLGVLFAYILIWALTSYYWVGLVMKRERRAHEHAQPGA